MSISIGSVSIDIVPDFSGVVDRITAQATQWGDTSGAAFSRAWSDRVKRDTNVPVGPSVPDSEKQGDGAGGAFADAFKKRVQAAFDALPDAKITADSSDADRKIADIRAALDELSGKTVGVDISDTDAKAKLDELKASLDEIGRKSESVSIKVDTAAASAELAKFRAEVDAATEGSSGGGGLSGFLSNLPSQFESAQSAASPLIEGIASLGTALIPIGAVAAASLGAIASAALAGATGLGVLYLGLADVVKAVSAVSAAQLSSAADAQASAQAQESAAHQVASSEASLANAVATAADARVRAAQAVENAQRSLADAVRTQANDQITSAESLATAEQSLDQARITGAQQVQTAEQNLGAAEQTLTNAVYTEQQAQLALVDARKTAQDQLESYQQQIADGALTQRQAILNVEQAQQNLNTTMANPASTDLQRQQAQLAYDQAIQSQKDQAAAYQDLQEQAAAAAKAGVDGATNVLNAQHNLQTATEGVATAQQGVASAQAALATAQTTAVAAVATATQHLGDVQRQVATQQITDAERVQTATQAVGTAIAAQASQQRSSAFAISQAQAAVTQALELQNQAASKVSSSQAAVNAAMAQLSPAGKAFVTFITGSLMPAFSGLKSAAETGLLPGIEALVKDLLPFLPDMTRAVGYLATVMGDLFSAAGKALTDPFWTQFFAWFASSAAPILSTMGATFGGLAKGFAGLVEAFQPVTTMFGQLFLHLATSFGQWATQTGPGQGISGFIAYVIKAMPTVVSTIESIVKAIGHILVAAAPIGLAILPLFKAFADLINAIPTPVLEILVGVVAAVAAVFLPLPALIALFVAAIALLVENWSAVWTEIKGVFDTVSTAGVQPVLDAVVTFFTQTLPGAFGSVLDWLSQHWPLILAILSGPIGLAVLAIVTYWSNITGAFSDAWNWISGAFSAAWNGVKTVVTAPIDAAVSALTDVGKGAFALIKGAFQSVWDWVSGVFKSLWGDAKTGVAMVITGPLDAVAKTVAGIWIDIKKAFETGINDVLKLINDFIDGIDKVVGAVPGLPNKLIPDVPLLAVAKNAGGGIIPGYAPGVDSVLSMVSPGEAILRPEVTRWLGPDTIHGWNAAASGGRLPGFADGGIMGYLGNLASSGWSLNPLHDVAKLGADAISALLAPVKSLAEAGIGLLPDSFVKTLAGGIVNTIFGSSTPKPSTGGVSPGVEHWAPVVTQVLGMLNQSNTLLPNVLRRMNQESGGNPSIVNTTDSNWMAGHPSVGLMQVIAGTFRQFAGPLASTGPFEYGVSVDPLANIFAGLNYALHAYPSLGYAMDKPGGYDSGGWLQPGLTWNGTGAPEAVLTAPQWNAVMTGGGNAEMLAELRRVSSLLEQVPEGVAAGVSGEFTRSQQAAVDRMTMLTRTGAGAGR